MSSDQGSRPLSRRGFLKLSGSLALLSRPVRLAANEPPIVYHGDESLARVALTFDDCYSFSVLRQLERELLRNPFTKVTFFPVGVAVREHLRQDPHLWRRLASRGHEIGYHTLMHRYSSTLSASEMVADYDGWLETISGAVGWTPEVRFARPPYADISNSFLELCARRNLVVSMWSASWGGDPKLMKAEMERVSGGDIVLFHMGYWDLTNFRSALPLLRSRALRTVSLSDLLYPAAGPAPDGKQLCSANRRRCLTP